MQKIKTNGGDLIPDLLRDENTGAIIKNDRHALNSYMKERERILNNKKEMEELKNRMNSIESSLDAILKLLKNSHK